MNDSYRSYSVRSRSASRLPSGLLWAAAGLAASWLFVQARSRQVEREHPPEGKFVTVDGVRLHYLERGEGPALVLLHGNGVYSKDFELSGLLDMASSHYRVIAFDRPGFGYSERPRSTVWTPDKQARLLHHALQEIGVDSAIVLGHSWGTMVALAMGLQVPDFVRGLVDGPAAQAAARRRRGKRDDDSCGDVAGQALWRTEGARGHPGRYPGQGRQFGP